MLTLQQFCVKVYSLHLMSEFVCLCLAACGYFGHTWSHGYFGVWVMCQDRSTGAATANCNVWLQKTKQKKNSFDKLVQASCHGHIPFHHICWLLAFFFPFRFWRVNKSVDFFVFFVLFGFCQLSQSKQPLSYHFLCCSCLSGYYT